LHLRVILTAAHAVFSVCYVFYSRRLVTDLNNVLWFRVRVLTGLRLSHSSLSTAIYGHLAMTVLLKSKSKSHITTDVSRPVSLDVKSHLGSMTRFSVTVRQLRVCRCGMPFLTRERICCHLSRSQSAVHDIHIYNFTCRQFT
jgi:hypothetical protein